MWWVSVSCVYNDIYHMCDASCAAHTSFVLRWKSSTDARHIVLYWGGWRLYMKVESLHELKGCQVTSQQNLIFSTLHNRTYITQKRYSLQYPNLPTHIATILFSRVLMVFVGELDMDKQQLYKVHRDCVNMTHLFGRYMLYYIRIWRYAPQNHFHRTYKTNTMDWW